MSRRDARLLWLFIVLLVLTVFFLSKNQVGKIFLPKNTQPFAPVTLNRIQNVVIQNESGQTEDMYKKNGHWYLMKNQVEFRADDERIHSLITSMVSVKKDTVVSTNTNKQGDFGIGRKKIILKDQNSAFTLFIGDTANISDNFVRADGENEVFTASGFDSVFSPFDYRDLLVHFVLSEDAVSTIEIQYSGSTTSLTKNQNSWTTGNRAAVKERVDFFLNDLQTLKAHDLFSQKPSSVQLENPQLMIRVRESGVEKTMEFFQTDDHNMYLATASSSNMIFQIPAAYVDSLKKVEKDFIQD